MIWSSSLIRYCKTKQFFQCGILMTSGNTVELADVKKCCCE